MLPIDQIKRDVAARFTAAGLPGAAQAVLQARFDARGQLVCGGRGLGYVGSDVAAVPQAPRNRMVEGPDDYIRRALHAAASPSLHTVPAPLRISPVALPGVAAAQPWDQMPAAVQNPWRVVQLQPPPPVVDAMRLPLSIPAAAQHPAYQQRAEQVIARPGLSGLEALGALLPTDSSFQRVRQNAQDWPGLQDAMDTMLREHGPAAAIAYATAAMTDPEAQRLRQALQQAVARGREHTTWYAPTNRAMVTASQQTIASLLSLLKGRMERVGRAPLSTLAYREVQGAGGYVYQQRPDGTIYILKSPRGPGGQVPMGSTAWRAITNEIGPYATRGAPPPQLLSGLEGPPRRGAPLPPPPGARVPPEVHLHHVLVRVGLAAAHSLPEGLLQQLADDAVQAELAAARQMRLPPAAPAVVARRRAVMLQELRARRSPCAAG